jgi:hypothetical protein
MAALTSLALVGALIVRRPSRELGPVVPVVKIAAVGCAGLLAVVLLSRTDQFLQEVGIDTRGGATSALQQLSERTSGGGSGFSPSVIDSPLRLPLGVVTVIYRPLLFEARNLQALLAGLEGTFLLFLTLARARWLLAAVRSIRRQPFVGFALIYSAMFVVAYSAFANFGILVRERAQLYPLFFVLLAIPPARRRAGREAISPHASEGWN